MNAKPYESNNLKFKTTRKTIRLARILIVSLFWLHKGKKIIRNEYQK